MRRFAALVLAMVAGVAQGACATVEGCYACVTVGEPVLCEACATGDFRGCGGIAPAVPNDDEVLAAEIPAASVKPATVRY